MQISDTAQSLHQWMAALRRMFHRQPELAFKEANTARLIMRELDQLGIPYEYGGVGGGVVGRLAASGDAVPTIALRAEMDALPGTEATGLSFSSAIEGKMHACGHDAHMAMILGAAALLKRDPPPCHVLFVFQPAEERGAGARVIMKSGALKVVRAIFGGHVTHHYRLGEIMVASGVITAQSDRFSIRIRGRGGHGARPHEAVDAVVVTGLLIIALQTLVSREINPIYPSVVTIGTVRAGSAPNVIAETAELDGSIRTTLPEVRNHILCRYQAHGQGAGNAPQRQNRGGYPGRLPTSGKHRGGKPHSPSGCRASRRPCGSGEDGLSQHGVGRFFLLSRENSRMLHTVWCAQIGT